MNFEEAKALKYRDQIEHITLQNADGSPLRARVNGVVKLWKRDDTRIQVPVKHGLRNCFYITADNMQDWNVSK